MKLIIASSALAAVLIAAPAVAQQAKPEISHEKEGTLTVQGVEPSKVLGAIDTSKLADGAPASSEASAQVAQQEPPPAKSSVTVETTSEQTPTATIETKTEVIKPVSGRPALDPVHPIAPEVQAVVSTKKRYTTKDIVMAQLEAVRKTPVTEPTTTITTTTTTPG
jgi:hypothetical protein